MRSNGAGIRQGRLYMVNKDLSSVRRVRDRVVEAIPGRKRDCRQVAKTGESVMDPFNMPLLTNRAQGSINM